MRKRTGTSTTPPPAVVVPLKKQIYVSDFDTICGNNTEENSLLTWCQTNNIDTLYLYDLTTVWASSYGAFIAFYDKAKTYGIKKFFAQRGSELRHIGTGFSSTKSYNLANPTRPVHFGFENEFWNYEFATVGTVTHYANIAAFPAIGAVNNTYVDDSDSSSYGGNYVWQTSTSKYVKIIDLPDALGNIIFRNWIKSLTNIYNYAKSVGLECDVYIGHFHDDIEGTSSSSVAMQMLQKCDTIEVSWYVTSAEFLSSDHGLNFLRDRLNEIGAVGIALGRKINVVIIYAGTAPLMESWFATVGNTLLKALNVSISIINSNPLSQLTAKAGFNVAGFHGYAIAR